MNNHEFYTAVGESNFCVRYFALCKQFPIRDIPLCPLNRNVMAQLLLELGRTMHLDIRDNSYSCDEVFGQGTLHIGFVIQKSAILEFWFWMEQGEQRIGSNYAVIAYEAAKLSDDALPQPTCLRPEFHNVDELRLVLAECFDLADSLHSIVKRGSL